MWNIELNFFMCISQQVRFIDTEMSKHLVTMKMKMKLHQVKEISLLPAGYLVHESITMDKEQSKWATVT